MKYYRNYTDLKSGKPFQVEIEINLDEVAQTLAARAFHSKGQKSQTSGGDIKCKVIEHER